MATDDPPTLLGVAHRAFRAGLIDADAFAAARAEHDRLTTGTGPILECPCCHWPVVVNHRTGRLIPAPPANVRNPAC